MTKPVRLQGAGALSTAINVVTTPAESIQAWLDKVGNLLLSTPAYLLPNQPAMTPAPFMPGDVAAVVGDEGPGVMVLEQGTGRLGPTGECRTLTSGNGSCRRTSRPAGERGLLPAQRELPERRSPTASGGRTRASTASRSSGRATRRACWSTATHTTSRSRTTRSTRTRARTPAASRWATPGRRRRSRTRTRRTTSWRSTTTWSPQTRPTRRAAAAG